MRNYILFAALLAVGIAACGDAGYKPLNGFVLPQELSDCKIFLISDGNREINVVRCPHSDTALAYKQGKQTRYATTLSGDMAASVPAATVPLSSVPVVPADSPEVIEYKGYQYTRGNAVPR